MSIAIARYMHYSSKQHRDTLSDNEGSRTSALLEEFFTKEQKLLLRFVDDILQIFLRDSDYKVTLYSTRSYNEYIIYRRAATYLGTYFPRSYAEAFCIFYNLLEKPLYCTIIQTHSTLHILDVGGGSGGELIGLLTVQTKYLSTPTALYIKACDGNEHSLLLLKKVIYAIQIHTHHTLHLTSYQQEIVHHSTLTPSSTPKETNQR